VEGASVSEEQTPEESQTVAQPALPPLHVEGPTILGWYPAFLKALALQGTVAAACLAGKITRTHAYRVKKEDAAFSDAWDEALQVHSDLLEMEAERRAVEGTVRKKFTSRGEPVIDPETKKQYIERDYSDTLLLARLRAERPEKYRAPNEPAAAPPVAVRLDFSVPGVLELVRALRDKIVPSKPPAKAAGLVPPQLPNGDGVGPGKPSHDATVSEDSPPEELP
jgi:hypothetical protein